ncbi:hypothetical protein KR009_012254 [Drosophila setifemur]|nr:hypothetical protein KR009_012254 [Drosophila setifemur]
MAIAWLTFLGLFLQLSVGLALVVPQHNCEDYFSYYRESDGSYYGLFTAPRAGINSFAWEVVFNARGTQQAGTVGSLLPFPNKEQAFENIHNGEKGEVFVRFQNFGDTLPKLIRAELNEGLLCSNPEYDAPSSTMTRRQSMSTTTQIRQKIAPAQTTPRPPPPTTPRPSPPTTPWTFTQFSQLHPLHLSRPQVQPRVETDYGECGKEGFATVQIGGDQVTRGQYPWLAALYVGTDTVSYKCVVSVISQRTVITAAHCVHNRFPANVWVYLGRHDRNQNPENGASLVGVSTVHTPTQYTDQPIPDWDLGLLILREAIVYTRYIQPLCLWSSGMSVPRNEGDTGAVAGWGYDRTAQKTRFPKTVNVQLVNRETCLAKMARAEDFITERTICAGNAQAHGPCFGDSGAALIVLRNNRWVMRGVVSLSPRQGQICDLSQYAIYCDITKHLDWIRQNMVN